MIATNNLKDFNRMYSRLLDEGKKPRWFSLGNTYFICNENILEQAIDKYGRF